MVTASSRAVIPSAIPAASRANTDAIGSPARTGSPGFTVMTKPTVGSTASSTAVRPPPSSTMARPIRCGSTLAPTPAPPPRYTSTPRARGSTPGSSAGARGGVPSARLRLRQHAGILDDGWVSAWRLDDARELLERAARRDGVLEPLARVRGRPRGANQHQHLRAERVGYLHEIG